ncbi:MAG: fused MFS/spermidine synthase [Thermoleophilia bacterium]|nr:fused MFS/spermidine synthase [Thermoleophilia bacterium]
MSPPGSSRSPTSTRSRSPRWRSWSGRASTPSSSAPPSSGACRSPGEVAEVSEPAVAEREAPPRLRVVQPAFERRRTVAIGFAVFASGAVLLGVEIAASRVVAPFFGTSLFVWGSLIGVVLTGLAIGYWAGGALADRLPAPYLLLGTMALGATLVLAIPFVDGAVLEAVVEVDLGPRLNPLIAAIVLFGPMSVVFAGVTPIAVRLLSRSVTSAGRTAGRLFAISTAGSIVGTFATAFFLVPEFGTNQLLAVASLALFLAIALVALVERMPLAVAGGLAAAGVAALASASLATGDGTARLAGAAARNWSPVYRETRFGEPRTDYEAEGLRVRYSKDTRYHRLAVVEDDETRYLRFDSSWQGAMYVDRPFATRFDYSDYFQLGLAYNPSARDYLMVGLGAGSALKRLWRDFPQLRLQTVELDPVVVDVARRWFELPRDPRLAVEVEDGRRFLVRDDRRWDVIGLDAYFSDSIPFHLTTREFLELVKSRLRPGGVVVANVIGALEGPQSRLFRSFYRTYRSVFTTVTVHPVIEEIDGGDTALRNLMVVASDGAAPQTAFLAERWRELANGRGGRLMEKAIRNRYDRPIPMGNVPVLTDDYAPTDALLLFDG